MILKCILILLTRSVGIFLSGVFLFLLGLPIVAIALRRTVEHPETLKPFTQYPGSWMLVSLPPWASLWDNPVDGMLGDKRGWWNNYCKETYKKPCTDLYSMWQWAAIRNSANYWSRVVTGVNMTLCKVTELIVGKYWKFLVAVRNDGKLFPLFEGSIPYKNGTHCCEWRFGWKISDTYSIEQPFKGSVFRFRPWKHI